MGFRLEITNSSLQLLCKVFDGVAVCRLRRARLPFRECFEKTLEFFHELLARAIDAWVTYPMLEQFHEYGDETGKRHLSELISSGQRQQLMALFHG